MMEFLEFLVGGIYTMIILVIGISIGQSQKNKKENE